MQKCALTRRQGNEIKEATLGTDPAYESGDGAAQPVEDVEGQEAAHGDEEAI